MSHEWSRGLGEGHAERELVCRAHRRGLGGGKWTRRDEEPKFAPDRTCDVEHLKLELKIDLPRQTVDARATLTLAAAYGPFTEIVLDAVDLEILGIADGSGKALRYSYLDRKLTVVWRAAVKARTDLVIDYRVVRPSEGLYFMGPTAWAPKATWQLWSQGEDEEARHWIPCHDAPHERMTTELIATVGANYTVISNGALVSRKTRGTSSVWHFRESTPYPSYLITLVVGEFVQVSESWRSIPVEYYVEPGLEAEARRSFGRTPAMIEFFSERLDCSYPYEKYAQVTVRNFTFGGMENLSATTQTDNTLHDARAALDFSSDDLVAHELAHQWFGDLLTCESWAHAWLNEGFATYSEALWKEHSEGRDEFDYLMLQKAAEYMAEPYRRPIVSHRYAYPFQLFDAHLYPKGAWVLHMLRRRVGDDLFWRSVRLYLKRHRGESVETLDLIRCFEQASGKSLQGFFHQWLNCPGHPDLEGSLAWDSAAKCVIMTLKQTQKLENGTPVYRLPLAFDARLEDGSLVSRTFEMDQAAQTFYLQLPSRPVWVAMDADGSILRTANLSVPLEWSEAALTGKTRDARVLPRIEAVRQAGAQSAHRAVALLARVLREDPFWGVQLEAASALGKLQTPAALDALIAGLKVKHPKARRGVVTALGGYNDPRAVEALRAFLAHPDPSYYVQMSALTSFGRAAGKDAVPALRAELKAAMKRKDWHDLIAQGAAIGLAATRDESVVDDLLTLASQPGRYWGTRLNTYHALAELGAARPALGGKIAEGMVRALDDPDLLVAQRAPGALVSLQQPSVIGALRRKATSSSNAHTRESCLMAAEEIAAQASRSEAVDKLQSDFEKLRAEARELRERLDKMSAGRAPVGPKRSADRSAEASAPVVRSSVARKPGGRSGRRGRTGSRGSSGPKEG